MKWLIIGAFGFCVLWGAYYFLKYLLDPSIKTIDEVKQMGIPVIGCIENNKKNGNLLDKMEQKRNGKFDTVDYISSAVEMLSKENILLSVDTEMRTWIFEELVQKNKNICLAKEIQSDVNALIYAKKADGVVLTVTLRKTQIKKLQRELEVCRMQRINVLGIIVTM